MHACAESGNITAAQLLLQHGAALDVVDVACQTTPLGYAARSGQTAMVRWLIEKSATREPNSIPEWATPLSYAHLAEATDSVQAIQD